MSEKGAFNKLRSDMIDLYNTGDYGSALELVETQEPNFPDELARIVFWKMCLLSLEGKLDEALSTFRNGLDDGLWWAEVQFNDTDLDPLRELADFKKLVAESKRSWELAHNRISPDRTLLIPDTPNTNGYPLLIALHGRNGNKGTDLEYWETAHRMGWAVLSPQSTQALFPNSYCWDDYEQGIDDILFHMEEILSDYPIDRDRIIIAGFSQGSGMAIYAALRPEVFARGFISIGTWWPETDSIATLAKSQKQVRGYFITGEKDYTLERAKEIHSVLRANNITIEEEVYTDLGHEFPADFKKSFSQAVEFIFRE